MLEEFFSFFFSFFFKESHGSTLWQVLAQASDECRAALNAVGVHPHIACSSCRAPADGESRLESTYNLLNKAHHQSGAADFALFPPNCYFSVCVCNIYLISVHITLKERFF